MSNDSAGRILTIIGLVFNGVSFILLQLLLVHTALALIWSDPLLSSLTMPLLASVVAMSLPAVIVGLVLPSVGYFKIRPKSKNTAGAILIVSGVIGLPFTNQIGCIFLLMAGIVVAAWQPLPLGG